MSNYHRFRNMILGLPFDADVAAGEELLLLPIFTTFGNHDHRLHLSDLHCKLCMGKDILQTAIAEARSNPVRAVAYAVIGWGR